MAQDGMPPPSAIWVALGIVVWAVAEALEDGRGKRFLDALERRAAEHENARQIVAFGPVRTGKPALTQATRAAAAWVGRVAAVLRSATRWKP